jgi:hypothetical protein
MTGIETRGETNNPAHKSKEAMRVDKMMTDDVLSLMNRG